MHKWFSSGALECSEKNPVPDRWETTHQNVTLTCLCSMKLNGSVGIEEFTDLRWKIKEGLPDTLARTLSTIFPSFPRNLLLQHVLKAFLNITMLHARSMPEAKSWPEFGRPIVAGKWKFFDVSRRNQVDWWHVSLRYQSCDVGETNYIHVKSWGNEELKIWPQRPSTSLPPTPCTAGGWGWHS